MARVASQIKQLGINFDSDVIDKLPHVVKCEVIEGVEIDEAELASMEEMMREASSDTQHLPERPYSQSFVGGGQPRISMTSDSQPITRSSLAVLMGEPNDLLSESPVFQNAKGVGADRQVPEILQSRTVLVPEVPEDPLDEQLVNEINDYL